MQVPDWSDHSLLASRGGCSDCARPNVAKQVSYVWPDACSAIVTEGLAFVALCADEAHLADDCLATWMAYVRAVKHTAEAHPSSRFNGHVTLAALAVYGELEPDYDSVVEHVALAWACAPNFTESNGKRIEPATRNASADS
jgi:hypothetical protein